MPRPVLFKATRIRQKDVGFQVLVDDGWKAVMSGNMLKDTQFWREVERGYKRAAVVVVKAVRRNIQASNAVATGFMRNNIISNVDVVWTGEVPDVVLKIGTMAWYDILVHEGLGRHSPTGNIPERYVPTEEQKAIVPTIQDSGKYWKPSPKVPRPFLKLAIQQTKGTVKNMMAQAFRDAFRKKFARGSKRPRHNILKVLNSSPRGV
jgi:hypothetical protein